MKAFIDFLINNKVLFSYLLNQHRYPIRRSTAYSSFREFIADLKKHSYSIKYTLISDAFYWATPYFSDYEKRESEFDKWKDLHFKWSIIVSKLKNESFEGEIKPFDWKLLFIQYLRENDALIEAVVLLSMYYKLSLFEYLKKFENMQPFTGLDFSTQGPGYALLPLSHLQHLGGIESNFRLLSKNWSIYWNSFIKDECYE